MAHSPLQVIAIRSDVSDIAACILWLYVFITRVWKLKILDHLLLVWHSVCSISTQGSEKRVHMSFHVPSKCHPIPSSGLFLFRTLILGQIVLLQQCLNLVRAPQSVVDLAILRLADGCKLN